MLTASELASQKLQEEFVRKCGDIGIGFRLSLSEAEAGGNIFTIRLDRQQDGDWVQELNGVKMLLDEQNINLMKDYELDYIDQPDGGFLLRERDDEFLTKDGD